MSKSTLHTIDCTHMKKLASAYRTRHQFLQLAIALIGEEETSLKTLAEYHQIEAELQDLSQLLQTHCLDDNQRKTTLDSEALVSLEKTINQKTTMLSKLEKESKVVNDFFDRLEEIEKARLAGAEGRLILLDAPSGYGKTRLLLEYIRTGPVNGISSENYLYKGISFKDVRYRNDTGFLSGLIKLLQEELSQGNGSSPNNQVISGQEITTDELLEQLTQLLITIGTENWPNIFLVFEDTHRIQGTNFSNWLRDNFIPELRQRLLLHKRKFTVNLIVIGRFISSDWNFVGSKQLQIVIPPFNIDQIRDILRQKSNHYDIDLPSKLEDLIVLELDRLTAGHPRIVVEILKYLIDEQRMGVVLEPRHSNYFFGPKNRPVLYNSYIKNILEELLLDLPSESLREAYKVISIFRCFFGGMIRTLKKQGYLHSDIKSMELIDQLQSTGYITKPDILGFYSDHVLQRVTALHIRNSNLDLFKELHGFAWKYWDSISVKSEIIEGRKVDVNGTQQIRCILEALYHYLIHVSLEKNIYFGCFDQKIAEDVISSLADRLEIYTDNLRAGLEDVSFLKKNHLAPMLKNDQELKNEIEYILGIKGWSNLLDATSKIAGETAL